MNEELIELWNYRVMLGLDGSLSIRKVYYSEDDLIVHWDMFPVSLIENHITDLWDNYKELEKAFDFPVMMERDLENQFLKDDKTALPLEGNYE